MADKLWKVFERWVAKNLFDSTRNPGSGKVNRCDDGTPRSGDVISDEWEVECKCYKAISVFRWWDKLKEDARRSGKTPVLVLKEVGDNKDVLVVLHYETFLRLKNAQNGPNLGD